MSQREPFIDAFTVGRDRWGSLVWRRESDHLEVRLHPRYGLRFYARFLIQRWHRCIEGTSGTRPTRNRIMHYQLARNRVPEAVEEHQALYDEMAWRRLLLTPERSRDAFGLTLPRFVAMVRRPADPMGFTPEQHFGLELKWTAEHKFHLSPAEVQAIRVALDAHEARAA